MLALARSALRRASFASSASRCSTTVFTRNATTDEQRDPAKELEELERLVGEVNAAKLRNVGGIPLRLGTGVVVKGITRLRDEHQIDIEGKDLMRFMDSSVAARLDDGAFWTGLVRLRDDHQIEHTTLQVDHATAAQPTDDHCNRCSSQRYRDNPQA